MAGLGHHRPSGWSAGLSAFSAPVARDFSVCTRFLAVTDAALPRLPNHCCLSTLPTDALIDLKVRRRLGRFIPIWLNPGTPSRSSGTSHPSHSGGPRAGAMRRLRPHPRCAPGCRRSALCVMKAMMRICPPQMGHNSGNTS